MRLLNIGLVLATFLLGVSIMLLPSRAELACAAERKFASWPESEACAATSVVAEEEVEASDAAPEPPPPPRRRSPRPPAADPLDALSTGAEERIHPGAMLAARSSPPPAVTVLPYTRRLDTRAPTEPAEPAEPGGANPPVHPALAGPIATSDGSARAPTGGPVAMTSVPVPRDPDEARRLLAERYPPELKETGVGGTVVLSLRIDRQGRVRDPQVVSGSGHERLDFAALDVVRALRFTPALQEGRSVETRILHPLVFRP